MNVHEIKKAFGEMQIAVPINLHGLLPQRGMKINKVQILIGASALLLGSLVYLIDRPPDQTYFIYPLFRKDFCETPIFSGFLAI